MHQIDCDELSFITKHSILKQKLCDAATDALRAMRLEAEGYKVSTLELIDPEETPKNTMIKAIKGQLTPEKRNYILGKYKEYCRFLGVSPYLDKLLRQEHK